MVINNEMKNKIPHCRKSF